MDNNPDTIHVALFDNHIDAHREVDYFDDDKTSYVRLYTINEKENTVESVKSFSGNLSRITSNYILEYEKNRLLSVNANFEKQDGMAWAKIYEYNFDTQKLIRTYSISHKFYRGYNVIFDANSCIGETNINGSFLVGEIRGLVETDNLWIMPFRKISKEKLSFSIQRDVLYLYAKNHEFTQIIFNGKKHSYVYDISDIKYLTTSGYSYDTAIPLCQLEPDTYVITGMVADDHFKLGATITIKE